MATKVSHLEIQGRIGSTEVSAVWFCEGRVCGVDSQLGKQGKTRGRYIQLSSPVDVRTISTHKGERVLREDFRAIQKRMKSDVRFQVAQRAGEAVLTEEYTALRKALELLSVIGQSVRDVDFNVSLKNISTREKLEAVSIALGA